MAFNGYKLTYPTAKIAVNNDKEEVNSILSDDKNSWVLFNPDDDILSSTQRSESFSEIQSQQTDRQSVEDQTDDEQEESDEEQQLEEDEEDDLIDNLDTFKIRNMFSKNYDAIKKWKNNINNDFFDDNLASWDLDENLSVNQLDTTILDKSFYGDELIRNLNAKDFRKFKKIQLNLKNYLNQRPNYVIDQLLLKTLPLSQQLQLKKIERNNNIFNYHKNLININDDSSTSSLIMVEDR
ncbi:hypothetical protein CLIB1444_02S11628 [[Candida] jaroonii]|uniref:Uncharacterized protein n=1 Tax=[Candida] jaroonii TaxID=467808 RepID=A0ACA9Y3R7_9ASCO|nr:hypothetical protein CLIB1444_02S11628 [[Candida] jaroonii]